MDTAEELYQTLIAPVEERMIATVARIVRDPDDAADVLQEVQAVIWSKLKRIHRHPNPHAYIMRICVTRSYDAVRRRIRRREREAPLADQPTAPAPDRPLQTVVSRENEAAIHRALFSLPPRQAQALLLRAIDDAPYDAIACTLGCSENTARSHVSKGRSRLHEMLVDLGIL
ncbi:MAG: RNA polymerase sigma factor [Armatimonadota bacterium]|jgi:RNA polymerase sigma-70 factor (ECF subfamily)